MKNKQKIAFHCKLRKILYLIFFVCIPLEFYGQDFEWVYSTKATEQQGAGLLPRALIKQVVTDSNNDIYIAGLLDALLILFLYYCVLDIFVAYFYGL